MNPATATCRHDGDLAKINYPQRIQRIVFEGILHKRVSHLIFPPFRVPQICACIFGRQLPRHGQLFFGWHSRYWRLYDDGVFVYFESEESERPLGGVRLGMTDLPLPRDAENTVAHTFYPSQVNERSRLTVPSSTRILHLFTETPEDCDVLRIKITDVVNSMKRIHTDETNGMAVESRLYRRTSNGSLVTHLSVTDDDHGDDGDGDDDDDSSTESYRNYGMEQLRREVFRDIDEDVIDEKKRQICEEIGITIEDLVAEGDDELQDENVEAGKEQGDKAENDTEEDSQSAEGGAEGSGDAETVSSSGVVLTEEVIQDNLAPCNGLVDKLNEQGSP